MEGAGNEEAEESEDGREQLTMVKQRSESNFARDRQKQNNEVPKKKPRRPWKEGKTWKRQKEMSVLLQLQ